MLHLAPPGYHHSMDFSEQPLPCLAVSSCKARRSPPEPEGCRARDAQLGQTNLSPSHQSNEHYLMQIWSPSFRNSCDSCSIYVSCKVVRALIHHRKIQHQDPHQTHISYSLSTPATRPYRATEALSAPSTEGTLQKVVQC